MQTKQTTARTPVPLGSARRLTKALGGTRSIEPNLVFRYD